MTAVVQDSVRRHGLIPAGDYFVGLSDGERFALLPSSGLFYRREGEPVAPGRLVRSRISGLPVELVCVWREKGVLLDVLRMTRLAPAVLSELVQMVGWEGAARLAQGDIILSSGSPEEVVHGRLSSGQLLTPAGWIDGEGVPLPLLPASAFPDVVRLVLHFTCTEVTLVGTSTAIAQRVRDHVSGGLDHGLTGPSMLAVVRDRKTGAGEATMADFEREDLRDLHSAMDARDPGSFRRLLASAGYRRGRELRRAARKAERPPWSQGELRTVMNTAFALSKRPGGGAARYLDYVFGRGRVTPPEDAEARALLGRIFGLWSMWERRAAAYARAADHAEHALAWTEDPEVRHGLYYQRASAMLEATMLPGSSPPDWRCGETSPQCFPDEPGASTVSAWENAAADFEETGRLDPEDGFAWALCGLSGLLLGGRGLSLAHRTRRAHLERALVCYDKALALVDANDQPALEQQRDQTRRALDRLLAVRWYERWFGGPGNLLD